MTETTKANRLTQLVVGQVIPVNGSESLLVDAQLARAFTEGDHLVVVDDAVHPQLLHIPSKSVRQAHDAVNRAWNASQDMKHLSDTSIATFYQYAIEALQDDAIWSQIERVNAKDVTKAAELQRSTTRLKVTNEMRSLMIEGLVQWQHLTPARGQTLLRVPHQAGWSCDLITTELGVVAFVFEGRPNVVVDATGVLRGGNTVVFRIGSDALETARCILDLIHPSLERSGLPCGAVSLLDDASHAAAWALFRDRRVSLAIARGSGPSVTLLGNLARTAGVPYSLHGTGGAWMIHSSAYPLDPDSITLATWGSLDRKVCNTLNTICIIYEKKTDGLSLSASTQQVLDAVMTGLRVAAKKKNSIAKVHLAVQCEWERTQSETWLASLFDENVVLCANTTNATCEQVLSTEWEWEVDPEVALCFVPSLEEAIRLYNAYSPRFVLSMMSTNQAECDEVFMKAESPFFSTGITRWVDGQYAMGKPELGLTNWMNGRIMGRGGILTGDGVYSVKTRVVGTILKK